MEASSEFESMLLPLDVQTPVPSAEPSAKGVSICSTVQGGRTGCELWLAMPSTKPFSGVAL